MAKGIRAAQWAFLCVLTSLSILAILIGAGLAGWGFDDTSQNVSASDLEEMARDGVSMSGLQWANANLAGVNLSGADLRDADLAGANLSGADLTGADLTRAKLSKAFLFEAKLTEAKLDRAFLFDADLSRADLREANLQKADLRNANIDAILWQAHEGLEGIQSICSANIWGIKNAPDGFKEWALGNGAVEIESNGEWKIYLDNLE
jgi:uncharacterized protein YjbI with pentapeptide repeats